MADFLPWLAIGLVAIMLGNAMRMRAAAQRSGVRRGFSVRNLPQLFLFLAILFGIITLFLAWDGSSALPSPNDLRTVSGTVRPKNLWSVLKHREGTWILVQSEDGQHDLNAQDSSHNRQIERLKPGDAVTAQVDALYGQLDIWELTHNGITIQSYQDTYLFRSQQVERETALALWAGAVAFLLLIAAFGLRIRFGSWRDLTPPVLVMQAAGELADRQNPDSSSPVGQGAEPRTGQDSSSLADDLPNSGGKNAWQTAAFSSPFRQSSEFGTGQDSTFPPRDPQDRNSEDDSGETWRWTVKG